MMDFNLLEESFPGMKENISRCEKLGYPWKSKPFLRREGGEIIAHVGFLEYPMLIEGTWHPAGAFHAICTKATHRNQGYASQLIQEALAWAQKQYEFVILFTEIPTFYEKLSFQTVPEFRFHLTCERPKGTQPLMPLTTPKDNALFLSCFKNSAPLSNRLWVQDDGTIASFNTLYATYPTFWSLYYSPSINGILSFEVKETTLHLYDVIAGEIPSLDVILDHLPHPIEEIYFYFSPDRITDNAIPEPYLYDKGHLMVQGTWPPVRPFMIPPLKRC